VRRPVPTLWVALLAVGCVWISDSHHAESLDGDGDGRSVFEECDDGDPSRTEGPGTWFADADGDGFGAGDPVDGCWVPGLVDVDGDCDDLRADVHPEAVETCDPLRVDEDCDGLADDDDPEGALGMLGWYVDSDGDGWGDGPVVQACHPASDEVPVDGDCDDSDDTVAPDQPEVCDGAVDEDCDDAVDEAGAVGTLVWFEDADGDGYGDPFTFVEACEQPDGTVDNDDDCDDSSRFVSPGRVEVCDVAGVDEDCDGLVNGDDDGPFHPDVDGDGTGDPSVSDPSCTLGWVADGTDCDDLDPTVGAEATCP